jgi:hypothetical protein
MMYMKSWKYEKDTSTGEVYAVYHSVPIFKEHTGSDGTKYTQELLEAIADNNNDRIEETGDYCPIVGWHTPSDNDPSKDPPIIGFAENFRVEKFGKKNPKWCIYATFKIRKDKHGYFRDHPRRSVEIWPEDKPENRYIDPIAVLGAETPRQDLGLVYSKSAAGEESYMYSSVAGGGNTYVPGEVQRNGSDEGYDPELWNHEDIQSVQEHGSSKTSLSQVPATHKLVDRVHGWEEGSVNADIGGGRFDHYTETMKDMHGVSNHVYDPFNRDDEHNARVASIISNGRSDTATVNNVLNVIKEPDLREHVIKQAANAIKDDGSAYFIVHEGDRSGGGKVTSKGWQENRPTASYIDEIAKHFGDVKRKGKLIIAKKDSESLSKQQYDKPGPKDPRRTPAPKKDRVKGSSKNPKGSASKANEKIEVSDKTEASLKKKMETHNKSDKGSKATIGALKSVYRRGAGVQGNHRCVEERLP